MAQRFGPYCFVVNTDKISRHRRGPGLGPVERRRQAGKYGILESDDWNVFNIF